MERMSEIFLELEGYENLEVGIIRATKIREVLARILKLEHIPNEEVFRFKLRSQTLLRKLDKLVRNNQPGPVEAIAEDISASKGANGTTNGKGKRKLENDKNSMPSVLGMAPLKKKSKNGIKVYLTIGNSCDILTSTRIKHSTTSVLKTSKRISSLFLTMPRKASSKAMGQCPRSPSYPLTQGQAIMRLEVHLDVKALLGLPKGRNEWQCRKMERRETFKTLPVSNIHS
jgi:hypothetical protein